MTDNKCISYNKTTSLKELNDNEEIDFTAFMKNLNTNEMKMNAREDRESQKKISIALEASPREHKKIGVATSTISEDDEQEDDELLTLLVKNMRRMYHKSEMRSNPREMWKKRKTREK